MSKRSTWANGANFSESDERIGLIKSTLTTDLYFLCDVSGVGAINRAFSLNQRDGLLFFWENDGLDCKA